MLTKLVILNSKVYGKAEVRFDDIDSLQLVGPNNIGKSTLIYALNFLFVIDGSKMSFSGNRKGDKETIHHYFPNPNQSYILFEIKKTRNYCILLKRDVDGEIEYYELDAPYSDSMFFEGDKNTQRLLKFEELKARLTELGIAYSQYKNKSEVLSAVYQRGRQNDAAVWLEENVKTDGLTNSFSKVYRYLINSKLINNKTLKEALIIADNREHEVLNFSQKNKKDISDLLKLNDEIKAVKSIQKEFEVFRETVNQYKAKTKIVSEYIYAFNHSYESTLEDIEHRILKKLNDISHLQNDIDGVLKPKEQEFNQQIGAKKQIIAFAEKEHQTLVEYQKRVEAFEKIDFLQQSLNNLDDKRRSLELKLTKIETQKLSLKQVEQKLQSIQQEKAKLETQIKNFDEQLIHSLSSKQETKKLLNTIFSEEFTSLPASLIKKKVSKTGKTLQIFDGEIALPEKMELKDLPSVDVLKTELNEVKAEEKEYKELQSLISNIESGKKQLSDTRTEIQEVLEKIKEVEALPALQKKVKEKEAEIKSLQQERIALERDLKKLLEDMVEKAEALKGEHEGKIKMEQRRDLLRQRKLELEIIGIEPLEYTTNESLDQVFEKIQLYNKDREILKAGKDSKFDLLRFKLHNAISDEEEFIKFVEEEIACIHDKEKSIEGLLQSISTQFANPAFNLFRRYQEFKEFMYSRFNQKLSKIRISNIEDLRIEIVDNQKIIGEIKKISAIQDFTGQLMFEFDQSENLQVLNHYLDTGKKISFDELFDIELQLTIKGENKKVDLKDQVESDGTDRMIRLVIIMAVINRLALSDELNRVVLFIDEIGTIDEHNRPELVKFCREHHFIPIFAAPQAFDGFDKYYFIIRQAGKINVGERHAVISQHRSPAGISSNESK
jgi:DNA repair exonuclease SbcCD ATPase subunit